jgi:hypothetical protein
MIETETLEAEEKVEAQACVDGKQISAEAAGKRNSSSGREREENGCAALALSSPKVLCAGPLPHR